MKVIRLAVAGAVVLVLSGCFGVGPDPGTDPETTGQEPPDFSKIAPFLLPEESEGAYTLFDDDTAYAEVLNTPVWGNEFSIFEILAAWTPEHPNTYDYLGEWPQVEWSEIPGGYEWLFAETLSLTLTDTGTAISVVIEEIEGPVTLLSGSVGYDALSGSVTIFGEVDYDYTWEPSTMAAYDITIEIEYINEVAELLVIHTTLDGSEGEYEKFVGGDLSGSGFWPGWT